MTRRSLALLGAATLSVLASCGDEPPAPPSFSDTLAFPLPSAAAEGGSVAAGVWLPGPAKLEVTLAGVGSGSFAIEFEGREPEPLFHVRLDDEVLVRPVELPPGPARPARVLFEGPDTLTWRGARLIVPAAPDAGEPSPDATELSGSMAGRDVVIVLTDTLHAGHVSAWGYERPTTPAIDALAERGVRFERAYSQTSWTLPSVVSLFTGLQQEDHGVWGLKQTLVGTIVPLPERFERAGYRTVALVQNQVAREVVIGRGFGDFQKFKRTLEGTQELVRAVQRVCDDDDERPLFLYVHLLAPHGPYYWPEDGRTEFDPDYTGSVDGSIESTVELMKRQLPEDHEDVQHLVALYDEYLRYVDQRVGEIVATVEAHADDGALLLHTSDHGEGFMQHGYVGHSYHVFEELVHVPLTIAAEGLPAGTVVDELVSLMDIAPTLIEWCGLAPAEASGQGRSLTPLVLGRPRDSERPLFFSARYVEDLESRRPQIAVRFAGYKLVRSDEGGRSWFSLYDLENDPGERHDLSAERPVLAAALRSMLEAWYEQHRPTVARSVNEVDAELEQTLEALGYVEGGDDGSDDDLEERPR